MKIIKYYSTKLKKIYNIQSNIQELLITKNECKIKTFRFIKK